MRYDFEDKEKPPLGKRIAKEVLILLIEIIITIGLAYGVIHFMVEKTEIIGASMEPTLAAGDKIVINKMSYYFHDPKQFDVVVFKESGREHGYYNVKRVIGLPGDTVQIKDGSVYINGEKLSEEIVVDPINNGGLAEDEITLEENEYFVLGDNRNNSEDSRFANIGNIVKDEIVGKAWIRLNHFNFISKLNLISNADTEESGQ